MGSLTKLVDRRRRGRQKRLLHKLVDRRRRGRQKRLLQPFDWALTAPARSVRSDVQDLVLFPVVRHFAKLTTEGRTHLDDLDGPVVLVSNHTSHLDCPVILSALPRRVRRRTLVAAAADYFYKAKTLGAVTSLALGTVPFKRRDGSRQSIEKLKEGLRRGWSVLMFPEGGRSRTGELGHFKQGAAYICLDTHAAAVPIYIEGAHQLMPKGSSMPKQGDVLIRFGAPLKPRPDDDYASFTARMEDAILDLSGAREAPRAG